MKSSLLALAEAAQLPHPTLFPWGHSLQARLVAVSRLPLLIRAREAHSQQAVWGQQSRAQPPPVSPGDGVDGLGLGAERTGSTIRVRVNQRQPEEKLGSGLRDYSSAEGCREASFQTPCCDVIEYRAGSRCSAR